MRRHPLLVVLTLLAAGGAATGVWYFLPLPKMTAFAVFHVSSQPPSLLAPLAESQENFGYYKQAQSVLVRSRLVLNAALSSPDVANLGMFRTRDDPVAWLERNLQVDFRASPEFMRLSLEGDNPDELKAVIDAVKTAYIKDVVNKDRAQRFARYQQLEKLGESYRQTLQGIREKIRTLTADVGTGDPTAAAVKEKFLQEQIYMAQRELLSVESEMRRVGIDAKRVESKVQVAEQREISEDAVRAALKQDPGYQRLLARQAALTDSIESLKKSIAPGAHPPLLAQREKELSAFGKELEAYAAKARPEILARLRENATNENKRSLAVTQERVVFFTELKAAVAKDIEDLSQQVRRTNTGQVDLEDLKSSLAQTERTFDHINQEMESMKPELTAPARVTVWEEATVVPGIEGNRRLKYSGLAALCVLACGAGLITLLEARQRRIVATDQVSDSLGLRVIGTIPTLPRRASRSAAAGSREIAEWQYMLTECVDTTQTMLVHALESPKPGGRSILVSSALPNEGKTMLACHLATSLARSGFRTLLVDGDMRCPAVHRVLALAAGPGLCELLRGAATLDESLRATTVPGLSALSAGAWDHCVCEALSSGRWPALQAQLECKFDFVILDSAPLLLVADGLLLARHTDGVVLSVLWNVSSIASVGEARDRLTALGAHILGVVVNGLDSPAYRSAGSYYRPAAEPAHPASHAAQTLETQG
jgi:capsular exopolysaccharide synthesis family protein